MTTKNAFDPAELEFLLKCVGNDQKLNSMFVMAAIIASSSPANEIVVTNDLLRQAFKDFLDENGDLVAIDIEVSRIVVKNPEETEPVPAIKVAVRKVEPVEVEETGEPAIVDAEFEPVESAAPVAPVDELAAMRARVAERDLPVETPALAKILLAEQSNTEDNKE